MYKRNKRKGIIGICCVLLLLASAVLLVVGGVNELLGEILNIADLGQPWEKVECVSSDRYVHNTLNETQQLVYDEMLDAIMNMDEQVLLSTTDRADVKTCYNAICADYGEIFWMDKCTYKELSMFGRVCAVSFVPDYAYTPQEADRLKKQMEPVVDDYLECLAACESDYEKTEVLYSKLIREVGYNVDAENNQNILSVFLGKQTVCQGYASAAQYLLQRAGIPCTIITGTAQGQPHAWNMVLLDGDYYYLDVTWGNADYLGETGKAAGSINYGYLNITSDELLTNHQPKVDFPLGVCDSTENNYYTKNELFFDKWDADAIGKKLSHAYEAGEAGVSLKFSDRELLDKTTEYYIDERHITDYCEGISQIYYVPDTDLNILTIYF